MRGAGVDFSHRTGTSPYCFMTLSKRNTINNHVARMFTLQIMEDIFDVMNFTLDNCAVLTSDKFVFSLSIAACFGLLTSVSLELILRLFGKVLVTVSDM